HPSAPRLAPRQAALRAGLRLHRWRPGRGGHRGSLPGLKRRRDGYRSDGRARHPGAVSVRRSQGASRIRASSVLLPGPIVGRDERVMSREEINNILKIIIDKRAEDWGIEVSAVEVKDVDLTPEMKRAIARQAEAERERRAKVINAEGELQASEKLAQAAHIIGSEPAAIQLRYLQTVTEISA